MRLPRLRAESGYTLVELIAVMAILMIVLTALTTLFVSGAQAQLEADRRFQAQQAARAAADRMRREVHCADEVQMATSVSITVRLPRHCPTAVGGAVTYVVYATEPLSADRFRLKRDATVVADHLTTGDVFGYQPPSPSSLGRLELDFPVNLSPSQPAKEWRLRTDVVLRNTLRG
jgi:type II secretory pathway pseudopilin PulG